MTIRDTNTNYSITLQLNPATIKRKQEITYAHGSPNGALGSDCRFARQEPQKLDFDIVFDGTGVLENTQPVKEQIRQLEEVVYNYYGSEHEPNIVEVSWGEEYFVGRLTKMGREIVLYSPEGEAIRAKLNLSFLQYLSAQEQSRLANKSSPDLTHIVTVQAGDTLPVLCQRIYKNSQYYPKIARINRLVNFRQLKPGTQLIFPPIK